SCLTLVSVCRVLSLSLFRLVASTSMIFTLSLHDALPIYGGHAMKAKALCICVAMALSSMASASPTPGSGAPAMPDTVDLDAGVRSEEHTSELQSRENLVCRLLLEQKNHGLPLVVDLDHSR